MLTIILHNASLELVNENTCDIQHMSIVNDSKRRGKNPNELLLDISVHQSSILPDKLPFSGRPDLVHIFLLQYHHIMKILPDEMKANIKLYVHTKNEQIFFVPQSWRVPVNYIRFRGLMEKFLFEQGIKITEELQLLLEESNLQFFIEKINPDKIINLTEKGVKTNILNQVLLNYIKGSDHTMILIGGYQKGEIALQTKIKRPIENIQLIERPTTAWMILNILFTRFIN